MHDLDKVLKRNPLLADDREVVQIKQLLQQGALEDRQVKLYA